MLLLRWGSKRGATVPRPLSSPWEEAQLHSTVLECAQGRVTKLTRGMEHLPYQDRLREGLCGTERRRLRGEPRAALRYLKGL